MPEGLQRTCRPRCFGHIATCSLYGFLGGTIGIAGTRHIGSYCSIQHADVVAVVSHGEYMVGRDPAVGRIDQKPIVMNSLAKEHICLQYWRCGMHPTNG